jgi:hypothetical protein
MGKKKSELLRSLNRHTKSLETSHGHYALKGMTKLGPNDSIVLGLKL